MRAPTRTEKAPPSLGRRIADFLGSYALAVTLMLLLFVLTFLGTLEQAHRSLYDVQVDYFESIIHIYRINLSDNIALPLPLPGAYLILSLLAVNLIVGGLIRIRKSMLTVGVIIAHVGILVLLVGSFVEFTNSDKGHLTLFEGESSNEFMSYFDWEVVVTEHLAGGGVREHVIPHETFAELDKGETARATSELLPFDVVMAGWMRNARPYRVAAHGHGEERIGLEEIPADAKKAERNLAALTVQLVPAQGGMRAEAQVWGGQDYPARVELLGRKWDIHLRHQRWELPFEITLDDFIVEQHPGTRMASRYSSYVSKLQEEDTTKIHITMNEPLRHEGYTLYQSGWGPPDAPLGSRLYSTFSVVRNPSDRIPEYACYVIALGLLWVFCVKLWRHIKAEQRRHA